MPVVAAGELHYQTTAGVAPGQPDRRHGRFGAGVDQPDPLDRRARNDLRSQLDLALGAAPNESRGRRAADRGDHRRVGVPEDHRPPGAHQVDVPAAVHVGEVRPPAPMNPGVPPTEPNARTGEFTPPGMDWPARTAQRGLAGSDLSGLLDASASTSSSLTPSGSS